MYPYPPSWSSFEKIRRKGGIRISFDEKVEKIPFYAPLAGILKTVRQNAYNIYRQIQTLQLLYRDSHRCSISWSHFLVYQDDEVMLLPCSLIPPFCYIWGSNSATIKEQKRRAWISNCYFWDMYRILSCIFVS